MAQSTRSRRVGEQMQRELALLIQQELKDPRLGMITVSGVEVTRDFAHAKVFVTVLGDDAGQVEKSLEGLRHAAGFLRRELGRRMQLRTIPELHFVHDTSVERGTRLSALIDQAVASDGKKTND
ncbi:30S ribosome-binding factor RbfA [Sulfurivermis fontis]|uniref:30S ribosome-binding factor RbfA n=1 Tax=Sulfurivermis fontis TaxID=1972068 RepID=UPI000FDC3BF9|nr:30S ribosome-binding factor RbfA [Sulfurivermis fontis]